MNCLTGWLYDDDAAVDSLRWEDAFARMHTGLDEGYFEQLLRELVLENDHCGSVEIMPEEAPERNEEAEELAAKQASLRPRRPRPSWTSALNCTACRRRLTRPKTWQRLPLLEPL